MQVSPENSLAIWKIGNIYLNRARFDHAIEYFGKSIQQNPDLAQAYRDMGRALIQTQDYPRAVIQLKNVTLLDPAEPSTHYLLARAYPSLGNKTEQAPELELFQKLREAQQEREKPPDILNSTAQDTPGNAGDEKQDQ